MILSYITMFMPLFAGALVFSVIRFRLYKRNICGTVAIIGIALIGNLEYYGFELESRITMIIVATMILLRAMTRPDNDTLFRYKKHDRRSMDELVSKHI